LTVVKHSCFGVIVVAALLVFPTPTRADPITLRASDHPLGTDLSTMIEGMTLRHFTNPPNSVGEHGRATFAPVYTSIVNVIPTTMAPESIGGSIGGRSGDLFNYHLCTTAQAGSVECSTFMDLLEITFATPTDYIQILSAAFSDAPALIAYDAEGRRIDGLFMASPGYTVDFNYGGGANQIATTTLTRPQADISRVIFGGVGGTNSPTEITVQKVPEPSTLLFVAMGALGLLASKRRSGS
jgi:hypothetical protein